MGFGYSFSTAIGISRDGMIWGRISQPFPVQPPILGTEIPLVKTNFTIMTSDFESMEDISFVKPLSLPNDSLMVEDYACWATFLS